MGVLVLWLEVFWSNGSAPAGAGHPIPAAGSAAPCRKGVNAGFFEDPAVAESFRSRCILNTEQLPARCKTFNAMLLAHGRGVTCLRGR